MPCAWMKTLTLSAARSAFPRPSTTNSSDAEDRGEYSRSRCVPHSPTRPQGSSPAKRSCVLGRRGKTASPRALDQTTVVQCPGQGRDQESNPLARPASSIRQPTNRRRKAPEVHCRPGRTLGRGVLDEALRSPLRYSQDHSGGMVGRSPVAWWLPIFRHSLSISCLEGWRTRRTLISP